MYLYDTTVWIFAKNLVRVRNKQVQPSSKWGFRSNLGFRGILKRRKLEPSFLLHWLCFREPLLDESAYIYFSWADNLSSYLVITSAHSKLSRCFIIIRKVFTLMHNLHALCLLHLILDKKTCIINYLASKSCLPSTKLS